MDTIPIILVFVPLLMPVASDMGLDPIAFGVLIHYSSLIGLITPPVAVVMYILTNIAQIDVGEYIKYIWPFLVLLIFVGLIILFVPQVVTFLPNLILGIPK